MNSILDRKQNNDTTHVRTWSASTRATRQTPSHRSVVRLLMERPLTRSCSLHQFLNVVSWIVTHCSESAIASLPARDPWGVTSGKSALSEICPVCDLTSLPVNQEFSNMPSTSLSVYRLLADPCIPINTSMRRVRNDRGPQSSPRIFNNTYTLTLEHVNRVY